MAERILITKVKRTDATRAELYGKGHQYADLRLFDLSELSTVGIDPAALPIGQEQPARFWAIYELSDKVNKAGNPYKDVIALEAIDKPATTTSADNSALLAELRAIRKLLTTMAEAQGLAVSQVPPEPELEREDNDGVLDAQPARYGDGQAVSDNPAELAAYQAYVNGTGQGPASIETLRAWVLASKRNERRQAGTSAE
jgi:hypothetical protein